MTYTTKYINNTIITYTLIMLLRLFGLPLNPCPIMFMVQKLKRYADNNIELKYPTRFTTLKYNPLKEQQILLIAIHTK